MSVAGYFEKLRPELGMPKLEEDGIKPVQPEEGFRGPLLREWLPATALD